ncbi:MAG: hypothetical protein QF893_23190, partial [Alphaproteobacteria bacterium]|nr:hypothetical protein [Alphaproteobacteria bacterium]
MIKAKLDARLAEFYRRMRDLDDAKRVLPEAGCRSAGQSDPALTRIVDDQLMEITRLVKWLEYCRPFYDGNTRNNILILNKLLVEYGFVPAILAQRNDAPFFTDGDWCHYIREGMRRWHLLSCLRQMGLLAPVLAFRATWEADPGIDYARA